MIWWYRTLNFLGFHQHCWDLNSDVYKSLKVIEFCECSCGLVLSRNCRVTAHIHGGFARKEDLDALK